MYNLLEKRFWDWKRRALKQKNLNVVKIIVVMIK